MRSCKQDEISDLLVTLARKGKRVLRLKGGDPFVFGRGGEEAQALARAGVPFRIVPGITAGIGGLAYAGIPVTHRDTNHAVTFITGHGADGKLTKLDWTAVARARPRWCFTWRANSPARSRRNCWRPGENRTNPRPSSPMRRGRPAGDHHHLGGLGAAAENAPALAIIVIGQNVKLAEELDWLTVNP